MLHNQSQTTDTKSKANAEKQSGSILVTILIVMFFLVTLLTGLIVLASANMSRARGRIMLLQAQYAAESGADATIAYFNAGNTTYTGTSTDVTVLTGTQYKAEYHVSVVDGSSGKEKIITSTGKVYAPVSATTPLFTRTIRVTAQRTSTTSASSLTSRNIVYVASGVKNISAKDIYLNGYIQLNKNTTNLIAENIVVAGKNTGATNCSIGGTGNMIKPTSFSTPGQTKTQVHVAYNNCISPPGNVSNANFDVFPNESGITTIQSMYIPWSQKMDNTYSDANNCNDWTVGASPRNIPQVNGSKKTHYPNSADGVAASCGTSGSLNLGSGRYNITDNVHIRANLCSSAICTPTFYNPDATTKFVFVEGTINFGAVQSFAGSGPIVFITYGADPASKTSVCPYGGSIYIGNDNVGMSAKALFFLATNGFCMDKTKFTSDPALGGVGGKNIYISSSPGTPFDLNLDATFPTTDIPIDLAWRAARYLRL